MFHRDSLRVLGAMIALIVLGICLALVAIVGYSAYQHLQNDHLNHHAGTLILKYNLDHGTLALPPELQPPAVPPAPAPKPTPPPVPEKSKG